MDNMVTIGMLRIMFGQITVIMFTTIMAIMFGLTERMVKMDIICLQAARLRL